MSVVEKYKYRMVVVRGFPRSGNHYLAALIDKNFFDGTDYTRHFGQKKFLVHEIPTPNRIKSDLSNKNKLTIYISRDFEDVSKSIFVMRSRFGLKINDLDTLLSTPLKRIWSAKLDVNVVFDNLNESVEVKSVDNVFKNVNKTLKEYWAYHVKFWEDLQLENLLLIKYEDLFSDFQGTMLKIAQKLGSSRTEFVDIEKKVGWMVKTNYE